MRFTGFGDLLMHLSPNGDERFFQAETLRLSFTGAECNVMASLGLWGEQASLVSRLPEHSLARRCISFLRSVNIDTDLIAFGGKRMGMYFLEKGASVRSSRVIYDRDHSAFTESSMEDYDLDAILTKTDLLYLTGITPQLSKELYNTSLRLCREAHRRGIAVAYDVNYRPTLSTPQEAGDTLRSFSPYITYLIANEEHLKQLLSIVSGEGEEEREARLHSLIEQTRAKLKIPHIVVTVRRTPSASDAVICAAYSDGSKTVLSQEYHLHVVDRVGSGDAFSAGFLYAIAHEYCPRDIIEFAAAASAIKHTIVGDINYSVVDEIFTVLRNRGFDVKR